MCLNISLGSNLCSNSLEMPVIVVVVLSFLFFSQTVAAIVLTINFLSMVKERCVCVCVCVCF